MDVCLYWGMYITYQTRGQIGACMEGRAETVLVNVLYIKLILLCEGEKTYEDQEWWLFSHSSEKAKASSFSRR